MPKPQYNVRQTDTGSKNYNQPSFTPAPAPPKINPLKNWWNSIVNNAFNTNPLYSITNPFGVPAFVIPYMQTAYGSNTRRGGSPPTTTATMPLFISNRRSDRTYPTSPNTFNTINNINRGLNSPLGKPSVQPKPNQNAVQQYSDTGGGGVGPDYMSLNTLVNLGWVDPNASDPYEIGGSPYQQGVWTPNPELPPYYPGGWGGWGGGGGGGGYTAMPSSPGYTGYGGGYNPSGAPRSAYYQGRGGGYGSGYGGYAGGQSQRGAWYGALLQWNI